MKTAAEWAQHLVDNVSTVTQLDVEKDELPNVDDWRRNAEHLFALAIREARANDCPWGPGCGLHHARKEEL